MNVRLTRVTRVAVVTWFRWYWVHADIRASIKTTHLVSNAVVVIETGIVALFCYFNDVWRRACFLVQRSLVDAVVLEE